MHAENKYKTCENDEGSRAYHCCTSDDCHWNIHIGNRIFWCGITHRPQLSTRVDSGKALTLVVGVEFVKMLILHTPESVIEVLLYAVARQIIISHESAMENLVGVLAVALIFVVKKYFLNAAGQKK